ncbi:hypothetical protein M432DRAFT_627702 [Thermoascus aurantiacus ATCC 26904]
MRRAFSTAPRTLLQFIWKGTPPAPEFEDMLKDKVSRNKKLAKKADRIEIAGKAHTSSRDQRLRVTGQIFRGKTCLTSVHVYADGTVKYSKPSYNNSQE